MSFHISKLIVPFRPAAVSMSLLASNLVTPSPFIPSRCGSSASSSRAFNTKGLFDHDSEDYHELAVRFYPSSSVVTAKLKHKQVKKFETTEFRCEVKRIQTDEGLCIYISMPGLEKKHVKITVDANDNILAFQGSRRDGLDGNCIAYSGIIDLPNTTYDESDIIRKMNNGLLKLTFTNVK